jgi:hypothetical protein
MYKPCRQDETPRDWKDTHKLFDKIWSRSSSSRPLAACFDSGTGMYPAICDSTSCLVCFVTSSAIAALIPGLQQNSAVIKWIPCITAILHVLNRPMQHPFFCFTPAFLDFLSLFTLLLHDVVAQLLDFLTCTLLEIAARSCKNTYRGTSLNLTIVGAEFDKLLDC